jgi:hypothetical protein
VDTVENRGRFEGLAFHRIEDVHPGHDGSPDTFLNCTAYRGVPKNAEYFGRGSEETVCGGAEEVHPAAATQKRIG